MARYKVNISGINTTSLKPLTNEQNFELFKKMQEGDPFARDELIEGNLKLVLSILKRFNRNVENLDDMFQIGCIGLLKAIDNFDLSVGVCFSTYAVPLIIGEMRRANRDQSSIRVSRGIKDMAYKILDYKEKYFNLNGIEPSNKEIADTLNVEEDTIMIPFSAESKQGREEIWELIDSLVLPEDEAISEEGNVVTVVADAETVNGQAEPEKPRKQRWKAAGKETAKKTKKLQEKKAAKAAKIAKSKKKK